MMAAPTFASGTLTATTAIAGRLAAAATAASSAANAGTDVGGAAARAHLEGLTVALDNPLVVACSAPASLGNAKGSAADQNRLAIGQCIGNFASPVFEHSADSLTRNA
jgi:hypothetical protein